MLRVPRPAVLALVLLALVPGRAAAASRVFRIEILDRTDTPAGYLQTGKPAQWIQKAFGDANGVTVEWVPVARSKEVEQLELMMAARTAPDLCFSADTLVVGGYARRGALADLTDLVNQTGAGLKAFLGNDVLAWGVWGGKRYAIPGRKILPGASGTWIRKDWLDRVGLAVPTTRDAFLAALRAFKAMDPGGVSGELTPLWVGDLGIDPNLMYSFYTLGTERDRAAWIGPSLGTPCCDIAQPGAREGLEYHNRLYNEGLICRDFPLHADDEAIVAAISSGSVGAFTGARTWLWSSNVIPLVRKNSPDSAWVPCDPFANGDGRTPKFTEAPIGISSFVPVFSENADLAVKYLNWMADAQVLQHLVYGESGVHYDTSAEGILVPRTLAADAAWDEAVLNRALVLSGPPYATRELAARATVLPWVEDRYPLALFLSHFAMLEKDAIPPVRLENPPDALMKLGPTVLQKGREAVAKAVAAKPGDFDATFAAGLMEFLDAGARQIREELLKAWDAQAGR